MKLACWRVRLEESHEFVSLTSWSAFVIAFPSLGFLSSFFHGLLEPEDLSSFFHGFPAPGFLSSFFQGFPEAAPDFGPDGLLNFLPSPLLNFVSPSVLGFLKAPAADGCDEGGAGLLLPAPLWSSFPMLDLIALRS